MRAIVWVLFSAAIILASTACPQAKPGSAGQAAGVSGNIDVQAPQVAGAPQQAVPAGARFAWLTTGDGYKVAAWYWPVKGDISVPGIILLHQRGKDKSSWGGFPAKLVSAGFAVIAIDLRGHGETQGPNGQVVPLDSLRDADYQAMLYDVGAAHAFLAQQKGVDGDRVGIIGASIGANLALLYAAQDRRIRTVVALSPGLDYKSLKPLAAMKGLDKRPLFLLASKGDKASLDCIHTLEQAAVKEAPVSLREFDGNAHGTDLLSTQSGLDSIISDGWLMNYLPPAGQPPT